ncbi:splicing factor 3a subunit 3 [Gaeumannomyces tritici R3-111a-1]|uniref:Splicing factor 3a subunit 3 n=1 Tax=Gaeumannomyces tritici (strain R3-111a-1) TaxID=644352 RepID=J3NXS3_GAET3|nr:splicing factor 3a subunit 3 [Gaeumannomyces tritici R3-111a-1]EJT76156.1 splicing factor 3a subunit 3 [Gaeumannomyces tritici R3-111a-1]
MLLEDQRYVQEDLERLEQGVADRMSFEPTFIRDRLNRDHEVSQLLDQIQKQSTELIAMYEDADGQRSKEVQMIGSGDPFEEFYRQLNDIKEHHAKYPNEQAQNPELRYRPKRDGPDAQPYLVDGMFSGEEAFGKFFDLHMSHEGFINLPNVKHWSYLQYIELFDDFAPGAGGVKRSDKLTDQYFKYVGDLAGYLESFIRRTKPLEDLDKLFATYASDFETAWEKDEVPGWELEQPGGAGGSGATRTSSTAEAVWCADCEKEFKNENVHKAHLTGRKHIKAAEARAKRLHDGVEEANGDSNGGVGGKKESAARLKERAVAEREYRIKRLAEALKTEREETKVNVERRQGMTERERQQELENFYSLTSSNSGGYNPELMNVDEEDDEDDDGEEKIYNPLKLPLAWDGKPIPFWLYRLHGLGVEFNCEICGNFVYMGRRAYEKHFNEARHIYGLKCLGVSNTALFRDITRIEEALKLWEKIQRDRKRNKVDDGSVVQMEDAEGNVMPEKVYYDLQKQGLL